MPRFYFDVALNGVTAPDEDGTDLPTVDVARQEALMTAAEMAKGLARAAEPKRLAIGIRDEGGRTVATVRLSLAVEGPTASLQRAV